MPLRVLLTMVGLVVGCFGVIAASWAFDSEIYVFLMRPNFSFKVLPPPTPPWLMLAIVGMCLFVGFLSRHNGLVLLSLMAGLVCLGAPLGFVVFRWTPGIAQYALMAVMLATVIYGWRNEEYLDY